MNRADLQTAVSAVYTTFGAAGLYRRAVHEARRASGVYRRSASAPRLMLPEAPEGWPFRPNAEQVRRATPREYALARADRVLAGEHEAYRCEWRRRPATPAEWAVHPLSGRLYDAGAPWFRIRHFDLKMGDIKDVWEPARFGWAYDLARGWLLTSNGRYAEAFWTGFESFRDGCRPFRGVQWSCGQETAIRALAWLWAEAAFREAPATTGSRLGELRAALVLSAARIEDAIAYALSQRNNHGISEAVGLVALAARFHGAGRRPRRWLARGQKLLDDLILDQFADDGWYIQHSTNYLRVALDQLTLGQRVLLSAGRSLSEAALARLRAATMLLMAVVDGETGEVPNHGANDGALVLPLSTAPYRDFRPAVTAAAATFRVSLPADIAADRQLLACLDAPPPPSSLARAVPRVTSGASGWADAVTRGARLFARAGAYTSRPGHLDALHVDVWIGGRPVAVDAGSYRYAAPAPWANGLAGEEVHNTLRVHGHPTARRGPRFLWLSLPDAELRRARLTKHGGALVEMLNHSWRALGFVHRRRCEVGEEGIAVIDEIENASPDERVFSLHWLVDGSDDELVVTSSVPLELEKRAGESDSVHGWISEYYSAKRRATSLTYTGRLPRGLTRLVTGFGDRRDPTWLRDRLTNRDVEAAWST